MIPLWREQWIASKHRPTRVRQVWDSRFCRETLILKDGRKLTYFLDGPPAADNSTLPNIFCLHAMFLSGNIWIQAQPPVDYVLVCINRPGYFGSDAPSLNDSKNYGYADFANDMEQLANHLHLERFYVAGHSSGGPCSLACAAHLSSSSPSQLTKQQQRVAAVGLLSSDPEYAHESAPKKPWVDDFCIGRVIPSLYDYVLCCFPFARGASAGLRNDFRLETALYDFETEAVVQPVLIYVGENDIMLPPDFSRHLHNRLPNATLHIIPRVGHLSILRDDILQDFFETLISLGNDDGVKRGIQQGVVTNPDAATATTAERDTAISLSITSAESPVKVVSKESPALV